MTAYLIRRLIFSLATVFAVVTVIFFVIQLAPGSPAEIWLGKYATLKLVEEIRETMGLNEPIYYQYWIFIRNFASGNMGHSYSNNIPVLSLILSQYRYTIALAVTCMIIPILFGIPLGLAAAVHRNSLLDRVILILTVVWISSPSFWLGLVILFIFSIWLNWFPLIGAGQPGNILSTMHHLVLPSLTLGIRSLALLTRVSRSTVLDVLSMEYINTARAKGLANRRILVKHVLRNAIIRLVSVAELEFVIGLGGSVIIEVIFSRPGIGYLLVYAVGHRDYPLVVGTLMFFVSAVVLVNLIADLSLSILDPRIRFD